MPVKQPWRIRVYESYKFMESVGLQQWPSQPVQCSAKAHQTCVHIFGDIPLNLQYKSYQIPKLKWFLFRLAVVFTQSVEARCKVENEDVIGAALLQLHLLITSWRPSGTIWRRDVSWTNAGLLWIKPLGTNQWNLKTNIWPNAFIEQNAFENVVCKMNYC